MKPEKLIIRGDNILKLIPDDIDLKIEYKIFSSSTMPEELISYIMQQNDYFIMGIGNIVGWGDQFIKELRTYE